MVWAGDNYPQEYPDPDQENGPTDEVLELQERVAELMVRVNALEAKMRDIVVGAGGALYAR